MSLRDSQLLGLTVFLRLLNKLTDHSFDVLCITKIGRRETKQLKFTEFPWYSAHNTAGWETETNILLSAKDRRSGFRNVLNFIYLLLLDLYCRSQWPCGVRRGSASARFLGVRVRILPRAWIPGCYVLSGRDLYVGLITHLSSVVCVSMIMKFWESEKILGPLSAVAPLKKIKY